VKRVLLSASVALLVTACAPDKPPPAHVEPEPTATATPAVASIPQPASPIAPEPAKPETWELPGTLGPLTTRLELDTRFGKANVREETFDGAEGIGTYPALVVFPDDSSRRLELVLDADDRDAPIRELRVRGADSVWHDASGLRPGMSLAELVALNGAPISFYGVGWDYGGTVQDWHGGKLANAVGNPVFRRVSLMARDAAADVRVPEGDGAFRSDDAEWPGIGKDLVVAEVGFSWPSDGDE